MSSVSDSSSGKKAEEKQAAKPSIFTRTWEEGTIFRRPKEIVTSFRTDAYKYTPLPHKSCIRLLNIKPGRRQDMIEIDLRIVDLTDQPKYTALSYSWQKDHIPTPTAMQAFKFIMQMGKSLTWDMFKIRMGWREDKQAEEAQQASKPNEGTRYIVCNGKYLGIWPNLYHALLQLRLNRPGESYWIDAVCMNQEDKEEKGHQIQMMGRIYESAQMVTVWLGTCPSLFDTGMKNLVAKKLTQSDDHSGIFFPALYLLTRRWFRRLWVLQEACLAKEILFLFGEHEVDAQTLIATINWITDPETMGPFMVFSNALLPFWGAHIKYVPAILDSRDEFKQGGKWPLPRWLATTKGRKTSKVKDFIFAGLGLIQPETLTIDTALQLAEEETPPPLPPRPGTPLPPSKAPGATASSSTRTKRLWPEIRADIDAEPAEIFLNLAACLLTRPGGIDLLLSTGQRIYDPRLDDQNSWDQSDPSLANLPSWIFNPTSPASRVIDPLLSLGLGRPNFSACTQRSGNPKISADGKTLHLDSIVLDEVEEQWDLPWLPEDVLKQLMKMSPIYETTGEDILQVVARVMSAGLWSDTYPPPADAQRALQVWLCKGTFAGFLARKKKSEGASKASAEQLQEPKEKDTEDRVVDKAYTRMVSDEKIETEPAGETNTKEKAKAKEANKDVEKHKEIYEAAVKKFPQHEWPKFDELATEKDLQLADRYSNILLRMIPYRGVFVTKRGMLGLGPSWIDKGDVVMLVKGAAVPYVFAPVNEDLKRKIDAKKKALEDPKKGGIKGTKMRLDREIKELEAELGKKDAWRLVGEAYVEGVMMGEAVVPSDFRRIAVV